VIVLAVGMAFIMAGSVLSGDDDETVEEQTTVVDFTWLNNIENVFENKDEDNNIENDDESIEGDGEETLSEDEKLYQESIDKGENVRLVECADEGTVTFAFAGDVLLDDNYAIMYRYKLRGSDINDTFSYSLLERMRSADIFMLNNEFPFSDRGEPTEDKQFTFRADPSNVSLYEELGVDIVSLANNHAYDYGEDALLDTFDTLEKAGIPYVGAGRNIDEAKKPVYFIANGIKIAVVNATQIERNSIPDTKEATEDSSGVLRCMDETKLLQVIEEAKANSDFLILYIHWGTENVEETDWLQDKQALDYANAGVDLIIGDHPHCLQKLDSVSGVPVAYSLGNFWFNSKTVDTCLIEVGINKDGMEYFKFVPCRQSDCRTVELEGSQKEELLDYMRSISPNVVIDDEGYVTF
jgi:poly-gamma-glutamate synthesis protein (capsule biosynthesis protein)